MSLGRAGGCHRHVPPRDQSHEELAWLGERACSQAVFWGGGSRRAGTPPQPPNPTRERSWPLGTGCYLEGQETFCRDVPTLAGRPHLGFVFCCCCFMYIIVIIVAQNPVPGSGWARPVAVPAEAGGAGGRRGPSSFMSRAPQTPPAAPGRGRSHFVGRPGLLQASSCLPRLPPSPTLLQASWGHQSLAGLSSGAPSPSSPRRSQLMGPQPISWSLVSPQRGRRGASPPRLRMAAPVRRRRTGEPSWAEAAAPQHGRAPAPLPARVPARGGRGGGCLERGGLLFYFIF